MTPKRISTAILATAAAICAFSAGDWPSNQPGFVSRAEARFGRPLTPLSYAGVARRTTRRALAYGAAAGAVVGAPVIGAYAYPPGGCAQVVDVYGRVITRCR
jgi:hypothetical protein